MVDETVDCAGTFKMSSQRCLVIVGNGTTAYPINESLRIYIAPLDLHTASQGHFNIFVMPIAVGNNVA
ncbi:hypothetical protein C5615_08820 [Burkholderia cepacia]|uniref:Uncharacterized protein n=1 Tax=Burkholderia cepacia TaxID=292 RepID=A0A2S8IZ13_BURCE|nr:hypothetical protein C5615_08820 [Burkholderia cepacia]